MISPSSLDRDFEKYNYICVGELIEPLMLTEEVQDYIKRSEVKKKERRKRK